MTMNRAWKRAGLSIAVAATVGGTNALGWSTIAIFVLPAHKIVGGRISEDWEVIDFDGFKRQLATH